MDYKQIAKKLGAIGLALIFWQIAAMQIQLDILLVTPLDVAKRLAVIWQEEGFWGSVCFTFFHIVGGFFGGVLTGFLFAILSHKWELVEILLWPWMIVVKSVPVASFVLICYIWMSAQNLSIFISFLIVLPVVYHNVLTGLRQNNQKMEEMAKIFEFTWYQKVKAITLPKVRPYFLSACSVTAGMAWKAGVAAEIIGTPNGSIGQKLYLAKVWLDTDGMLAWTVVLVVISVLFEKLFMAVLRKALGAPKENLVTRKEKKKK